MRDTDLMEGLLGREESVNGSVSKWTPAMNGVSQGSLWHQYCLISPLCPWYVHIKNEEQEMLYTLVVFNCCLKEEKNKIDENVFFIKNQRSILSGTRLHSPGLLQECYFDM